LSRPVRSPALGRLARRAVAVAVALVADEVLGEPTIEPHPVAAFGRTMGRVERAWYADDRGAGARYALAGAGVGFATGALATSIAGPTTATALATYLACAGRALREAAADVGRPLEAGDLEAARRALPSLVGRDPSALDADEIARAVIESVAENTSDAVVATMVWGVAAGAPGALVHRALNTMDAMVGYRSPRYLEFGRASARADDAANWLPARATAALVALVRPRAAAVIASTVRRDAGAHPSPNAGVAEAAFAAALGLRLGGTNRYEGRVDVRPSLGDGRRPTAADIGAAVRLSRDVQLAAAAVLLGAAAGIGAQTSILRHALSIR